MTPRFKNSTHFKNFWGSGNGRDLLEEVEIRPSEETFHRYSPLYFQVDEVSDAVVKDTYLNMPYSQASALIEKFSSTALNTEDEVPHSLRLFFEAMQTVPTWFDPKLANAGAALCMRCGVNGLMILRDFTLMGGYDFAYLNKPLVFTGALKNSGVKRLKDTLEFWIQVTRLNALVPQSEAYKLIIRTRLMHSYARLQILENNREWNTDLYGAPINTWDMIATYSGFSLVFMQGLRKLGIKISQEEESGLYHLWKYVGSLLGIPADFLPDHSAQAVEQFYWWTTLQDCADADSTRLAEALLQENMENTIYKYHFQRKLLRNFHQSISHFTLDAEVFHRLKIPVPPAVFTMFPRLIRGLNKAVQKIYLNDSVRYGKLVQLGHEQQMKVLADYIKHTPKAPHK